MSMIWKTTMIKDKPKEILNDFLGFDCRKIYQRPDMFNFSLDSILLADFVILNQKIKDVCDLGTGFAPIPLYLTMKKNLHIVGVEIQEEVAVIAKKNIELNDLEKSVTILHGDINQLDKHFKPGSFDLITCNPPFFKTFPDSNVNLSEYKTIARHEKLITLKQIVKMAKHLLKTKGHLVMVHRTDRLNEILDVLKMYQFTVKRLRFVHTKKHDTAHMVLIDATKQGLEGLKVLPPLIVHENGDYTEEVRKIFNYGSV